MGFRVQVFRVMCWVEGCRYARVSGFRIQVFGLLTTTEVRVQVSVFGVECVGFGIESFRSRSAPDGSRKRKILEPCVEILPHCRVCFVALS